MGKINVVIESLVEEAKLIYDCVNDADSLINKLTTGLSKLSEDWKDADYDKFEKINGDRIRQLEQTKDQFENIYKILTTKVKAANNYLQVYFPSAEYSVSGEKLYSSVSQPTQANKFSIERENNNNLKPEDIEVNVKGEKRYKRCGTYNGMLKGLETQSNDEKKCHDEDGNLTFRSGSLFSKFAGKFENDEPIYGELSFLKHKYIEKYIGNVQVIDEKEFTNFGQGKFEFHKNKFRLTNLMSEDLKVASNLSRDIINKHINKYEGQLTKDFLAHGEGALYLQNEGESGSECIKGNFTNGTLEEITEHKHVNINEYKKEICDWSEYDWPKGNKSMFKCTISSKEGNKLIGEIEWEGHSEYSFYEGELKEI